MLRRFLPETIFGRRLDEAAERRLKLAQARAEEQIVDAHVENALTFVDTLAGDLTFDRAIDTYIRVMGIPEPLASLVTTRTLVVLGQELVPTHVRRPMAPEPEVTSMTDTVEMPLVDHPAVRLPAAGRPDEPESGGE